MRIEILKSDITKLKVDAIARQIYFKFGEASPKFINFGGSTPKGCTNGKDRT